MTSQLQAKDPVENLLELLESGQGDALSEYVADLSVQELVHAVSHFSQADQVRLMRALSPEEAADILEEIPESLAADLLEVLETKNAAAILLEMDSDDQADVLMEVESEEAEEILAELSPQDAEDARKLASYEWDTAGGLMVTEYVAFPTETSVDDVIRFFRSEKEEFEDRLVKYLYVVSSDGLFQGMVQMQALLRASSQTKLDEIAMKEVLTVQEDMPLDELSDFFDTYDFYSVPVLNADQHMVGVVRRKHVLEAYAEQVSIEHLSSHGIIGGEELRTMPVVWRSKRRLSWLSVNILLNMIAASVIAFHQDTLTSVIALAVFLPIISDMSGCSGNQAVAVSMRELSLGTVKATEAARVWVQEIVVGLINGTVLGILIGIAAWAWKDSVLLGIVVGGALALNTLVAVSLGGTVPLILKRFGVDPAIASGPILTTVTDMVGFFLALTFASLLLSGGL